MTKNEKLNGTKIRIVCAQKSAANIIERMSYGNAYISWTQSGISHSCERGDHAFSHLVRQ